MKLKVTLSILFVTLASFLVTQDKKVSLKDGYYKFPAATRVIMFYKVQDNKISFFRSHAGHYAAFGRYNIIPEDSILIIDYDKTVASEQFSNMEPFERDTIGLIINEQKEASLFGLRYVNPESEEFYKNFPRR